MTRDKDIGDSRAFTATENVFPQPILSNSADSYSKPPRTRPILKSKSTSAISTESQAPISSLFTSTSSLTSSRGLSKQNSKKILLLHPSIQSPSYAKKLENVKNVTILYNPASGNKRGRAVMQQAFTKFKAYGLEVTTIELKHPGHATEVCMAMTDFENIDVLCVVGGDGTFHEVVNGLMQHPIAHIAPNSIPALSVIPAGTGNSMARELQGISSVRLSTDEVLFGTTVAIDILKITILTVQPNLPVATIPSTTSARPEHYVNALPREDCDDAFVREGQRIASVAGSDFVKKEVIYAFNSIHWGLASRVLERAEKLRWMGHGIRYTAASLMEMLKGTSTHARVVMEDKDGVVTEYKNDTYCLLIANNISTAGKGMKMAPKAKINDGLIDLLLIRSHKPWHLLKVFEGSYSGKHVDLPYVEYKQVRKFSIFPYKNDGNEEVQANPQFAEELVDIDGELKGCTPFECEVLPQALHLII